MSNINRYVYREFPNNTYAAGLIVAENNHRIFYKAVESNSTLINIESEYSFDSTNENIIVDSIEQINKIKVFQ